MANRIKGITIEIGGDTTGLSKSLEGVNKEIRSTQSQLRDVERLLKLDPGNVQLLQQKQRLLSDAVGETRQKLDALKEAEKSVQEQFKEGKVSQEQYDGLQREIAETEQRLRSLEQQARNSNTALSQIGAAGEKLKAAGEKMTSAGEKLLPVTGAVAGVGLAAVKTAADFDEAMSKVGAVTMAPEDEMEQLRSKAREMGEQTKFSASEAAEAMNYMAMAGWKTEDMLSGIEGVMDLAAASGEDLGTTSDIVTDALTAFGLTAKDSGHFADVLAAASSNANTNVSMMGETFKYCAPIAGAMGFSVEDTAEAIGLMANAGIKSSQAGTALRGIMNKLTGDVKLSGAAIGDVTIATSEADGSMRGLSDILADCRSAFDQMSESEKASAAEALVGKNAMSGFLALMNAGQGDVTKLSKAIKNCDGTTKKMAATMQNNLNGKLTILKSQLQETAIMFGEDLMPVIEGIVGAIQGWVAKLNELDPAQRNMIITVAAVAAAMGPLLIAVGQVATGIGSLMELGSKLGGVLGGLGAAGGPVLLVVGAVAALSAVLWQASQDTHDYYEEAKALTEEEEQHKAKVDELYDSYSTMDDMRRQAVDSAVDESSKNQILLDELKSICDENGNVKAGYEERAQVIAGQLSDALGTEIDLTGNQIKNYQDLCAQLDLLIQKKQANALLEANEAAYAEALTSQTEAYMAYHDAKADVEATTQALSEAQAVEAEARQRVNEEMKRTSELGLEENNALVAASQEHRNAQETAQGLADKLAGLNDTLSLAEEAYVGYNTTIQNYEGLASAIVSGDQDKIADALQKSIYNFETAETGTRESLERQTENLRNQYEAMKEAVEAGAPGITQAQVDAMGRLVEASEQELNKLPEQSALTGHDAASGLAGGITEGTAEVTEASKNLANASLESMRTELESHSPSQKAKRIGGDFDEGYAGGITEGIPGAKSAVSSLISESTAEMASLPAKGKQWGSDFMSGFVSSITEKIGSLRSACSEVAGTVSGYMHFSRPDVGPLRDYEQWMPDFIKGLASGIDENLWRLEAPSGRMAAALGGGGSANLSGIEEMLGTWLPRLGDWPEGMVWYMVLDSGALVGELLPKIDQEMGQLQVRVNRGN